jgi:hypothetical protein
MAKFKDLYPILTLLPLARQQYSLEEFAQDIHRLDQELTAVTRSGVPFRIEPGSTGGKKRSNLLIVQSRYGREVPYYGIEFFASVPG